MTSVNYLALGMQNDPALRPREILVGSVWRFEGYLPDTNPNRIVAFYEPGKRLSTVRADEERGGGGEWGDREDEFRSRHVWVSDPKRLASPGGEVTIPTPTRADLILSAKQWTIMAYDTATNICDFTLCDAVDFEGKIAEIRRASKRLKSQLERIEKALTEAEALK